MINTVTIGLGEYNELLDFKANTLDSLEVLTEFSGGGLTYHTYRFLTKDEVVITINKRASERIKIAEDKVNNGEKLTLTLKIKDLEKQIKAEHDCMAEITSVYADKVYEFNNRSWFKRLFNILPK